MYCLKGKTIQKTALFIQKNDKTIQKTVMMIWIDLSILFSG